MLNVAKRELAGILDALEPVVAAATPVICLEPSCAAVFRDELLDLFPGDDRARRLGSLTRTFAEFLVDDADAYQPPRMAGTAVLHGHCHQKALAGLAPDIALLRKMDLEVHVLDSGCCGMAGAFGFHKGKYAVSMAAGERALLPAVRSAPSDALIVADGFSCREQIRHGTGRRALHVAQVLHRGLESGGAPPALA
jgi:Fe-S oxidoreductase